MKIEENLGVACVLKELFLGRERVVRLRLLSGLTALRLLSLMALSYNRADKQLSCTLLYI